MKKSKKFVLISGVLVATLGISNDEVTSGP